MSDLWKCKIKHPLYQTWSNMKARCYNPKAANFKYYGGRGIAVCDRWKKSFENFVSDIGPKPSPKYSLDRIDNDKGYSPENCRWATHVEQCNKRTSKTMLTYNGEELPLRTWADKQKINAMTLLSRINMGWSTEEALETPVQERNNNLDCVLIAKGDINGHAIDRTILTAQWSNCWRYLGKCISTCMAHNASCEFRIVKQGKDMLFVKISPC
jgi:hypothetical protein